MNEIAVVLTLDTEGPSAGKAGLAPNWDEVGALVDALDTTYRSRFLDSYGNPGVYSWFLLDWVGILENDSEAKRRHISLGHHAIFDWYRSRVLHERNRARTGDDFYWHYHHPFDDGSWGWNTDWNSNRVYEEVINRKIAERDFYPVVYATGGYVMSNECSRWLEKWVPFDFSSNAPVKTDSYDWSQAPRSWIPYQPSRDDYQKPGKLKRHLTLRKPTSGHNSALTLEDVEVAFVEASKGCRPILSVISHDYMESCGSEFASLYDMLGTLQNKYPNITWRNMTALNAMRWSLGLVDPGPLEMVTTQDTTNHTLEFSHEIFSEVPWLVEHKDDTYMRIVPEILVPYQKFRFPIGPAYSLGATDAYGNVCIRRMAS